MLISSRFTWYARGLEVYYSIVYFCEYWCENKNCNTEKNNIFNNKIVNFFFYQYLYLKEGKYVFN